MAKKQADINVQIRALIDSHDFSKIPYSEADKELLRQYSGDGGNAGNKGVDVQSGGLLNEFYTPVYICDIMYRLAKKYGYKKGNVLEPSCAIGNMIKPIYDDGEYKHIDAFETNRYTARICEILYPKVTVRRMFFEQAFLDNKRFNTLLKKTWLENAPYDLIIGNPPYGAYHNEYSGYFKKDGCKQTEHFFIYRGLQLLKSGGLLVYVIPMNFMATGTMYQQLKERIGKIAELVDAYRLPPVFGSTKICTDIIVLRKK